MNDINKETARTVLMGGATLAKLFGMVFSNVDNISEEKPVKYDEEDFKEVSQDFENMARSLDLM